MKVVHGDLRGSRKKGFTKGLYGTWIDIKKRCENKNSISYPDYGAKGISCEFKSYPEFKEYITKTLGKKPDKNYSLDRIDSKKNYSPGNLRWASRTTQNLNRGLYKNKTSKFRGVSIHKPTGKWKAQITINSKKIWLGTFDNEIDASEAYLSRYYSQYKEFPPEYKYIKK